MMLEQGFLFIKNKKVFCERHILYRNSGIYEVKNV